MSLIEDEELKVAPYAFIELTRVEPIPHEVDFIVDEAVACGGGRTFGLTATFSPDRDKIFGAPQSGQAPYPFFILKPGERDVFQLLPGGMLPGYYYHFRVGFQYSHKGDEGASWGDKTYVMGLPTDADAREWQAVYPDHFERNESVPPLQWGLSVPHEVLWESNKDPKDLIAERIKWEEAEVQKFQISFEVPSSDQKDV